MDQENLIEPEYYQRASKPHRSSILKTINTNVFSDDKIRKNENKRISFANNIFFQEILADGTTRVFEEPEPEKLITSPVKRPVDELKDLSTDISIEIDSKKSKRRKFLPKSIAITYDIDDGGDKNTVYNTFANAHLSENDIEIEMHKWLQSKPMELTNIDTNDSRCSNDNMLLATRYESSIISNLSQEMDISLDEEQLEDSVFESTFYNMNDSGENSLLIEKKKEFSFQSENILEEEKMADDVSMLKSYLLDQVEEKFNCDQIKLHQNDVLSNEQMYSATQETFENKNEGENTDLNEKKMDITSLNSLRTESGMKTCYESLTMEQTKVETSSHSGYMENKTTERTLVSNQMSTENTKNINANSESSKGNSINDRHVSNILNDCPRKNDRTLDENETKEESPVIESLCSKSISIDDSNEKENIDPKNKSMLINDTNMPLNLSFDLKNVSTHLKQAPNNSKNLNATRMENKQSFILENHKDSEEVDNNNNSQLMNNDINESSERDSISIHLDNNESSLKDFTKATASQNKNLTNIERIEVNQEIKCIEQNISFHHNAKSQDIQSENTDHHEADENDHLTDLIQIEASLVQTNFSFRNRSNQTFFEDKITANDRSSISLSKLDLSLRPQLTLPSPSQQQSTNLKNTSLLKPGSFLFCNTKTSAKFSNPFTSASIKWPGRHNESNKNFEIQRKETLDCSKIDISSVFTPQKPTLESKNDSNFYDSEIDRPANDLDKNTTSLSLFLHENLDKLSDSETSKNIANQGSQSPKNGSFTLEMPLERSFSFVEYDSSNEDSILSCVSPGAINNSRVSKKEFEELSKQNYELVQEMQLEQSFSFVEYGSSEEVSDLSLRNERNEQKENNFGNGSIEKCISNLKNSYKDLEKNSLENIFKSSEDSSTKCLNSASKVSSSEDLIKCTNSSREIDSCSDKTTSNKISPNTEIIGAMSPMIMQSKISQTTEFKNNVSLIHSAVVSEKSVNVNLNVNNEYYTETTANNSTISKPSPNNALKENLIDMEEKIYDSEKNSVVQIKDLKVGTKEEFKSNNDMTTIDEFSICIGSNKVELKKENMIKEFSKTSMNDANEKINCFDQEVPFNLNKQNPDHSNISKIENSFDSQHAAFKTKIMDIERSLIKNTPCTKNNYDDSSKETLKNCASNDFEKTMLDQSELIVKVSNEDSNCVYNVQNKSNDTDISKNANKISNIAERVLEINHETSNKSVSIPLIVASNPRFQNAGYNKQDFNFKHIFHEIPNGPLDLSKKNPSNSQNIFSGPLKILASNKCENKDFKSLSIDSEIKHLTPTKDVLNYTYSKNLKMCEALDCRINVLEKQNLNESNLNNFQEEEKHDMCETLKKDTFNITNKSEISTKMIIEKIPKSLSKSFQNDMTLTTNENILDFVPQVTNELKETTKDYFIDSFTSRNVLSSYLNDEKEGDNLFKKSLLKNDSGEHLDVSVDENNCVNPTTNIKSPNKFNFNEQAKKEESSIYENYNDNSNVEIVKEMELSCNEAFNMFVDSEIVKENNSVKDNSQGKSMSEVSTYKNNDQEMQCLEEENCPHLNTKDQDISQPKITLDSENLSNDKNHFSFQNANKIEMDTLQQAHNLSLVNRSNQTFFEDKISKDNKCSISSKLAPHSKSSLQTSTYEVSPSSKSKSHVDQSIDSIYLCQQSKKTNFINEFPNISKCAFDHKIDDLPISSNVSAKKSNLECSNIHSSDEPTLNNNTTTLSRFLQENLTQDAQEMPSEAISPELRHKTQNISISDVVSIDKWFSFVEYDSPELFNSTMPPNTKTRDSLSCFLNAWSKSNDQELEQSESNDISNETNLDLELLENSLSGYFERDDTYSPSMLDITKWSISDECDGNENSLFELREEFEKNMDSYLSEDNQDGLTFLLMNDEPSCRMLTGDLGKYENNCVKIDFNEAVFDFSCANFRIYLEFSNNDLTISRMKWVCRVDEIGKRGFIQIRNGRHEMIRMEEKALIGMYKLAVSNEFKNLITEMNRSKGFELLNLLERIDQICHKCESLMIEVRHIVRYKGAKFIKYIKGVYKWIYWILGLRKPIYVCLSIDPRNYPNDYIIPEFWFAKEDRILYSSELYQQAMLMEKPGDHTYIRRLTASTEKFIKFWKKHLIHLFD